MWPMVWRALLLASVVATGCAVGADETGEFEDASGGSGGTLSAAGGSTSTPPTSSSSTSGGMGGMGGLGGAGGMGGAGGACVFDHVETCETAELLPSIAGDESNFPTERSGTSSRWFQVQIREEVGSVFEEDLSYTVTLTSAPGTDYDLIIHQGGQDDPPNCNATAKLGVDQGGGVETVHDSWDDDQGIGGEDDHVWLNIEVRYVSGTECDGNAEWVLQIQGHT